MTKPPQEASRQARNREHDARRREAEPWRKWYGTGRWRALRAAHLREHPFCVMCKPRLTIATVCDHVTPHKGDPERFWSTTNLQSLCKLHHDSTKQAEEKGRKRLAIGPDGWPLEG